MPTFVVTGGDAAGMSAASKAKRDNPDITIVFEQGKWVSYGPYGLPYYSTGEIQSLEYLVSMAPEQFREERDIDLRTGHEVVSIDPDERSVTAEHAASEVTQR